MGFFRTSIQLLKLPKLEDRCSVERLMCWRCYIYNRMFKAKSCMGQIFTWPIVYFKKPYPTPPPPMIWRALHVMMRYHRSRGRQLVLIFTQPHRATTKGVWYAKSLLIRYFIDINILQNSLIDIDIFKNVLIDINI